MSRRGFAVAAAAAVLILVAGCSKPSTADGRRSPSPKPSPTSRRTGAGPLPPIPSESGSGQTPVIWVGGTLTDVTNRQLDVKEALGPRVTLKRLGQDATAFFRATADTWDRIDGSGVGAGDQACVETLLDGENLLALRVFLGADCGPAG
jgi:hypothetical protein